MLKFNRTQYMNKECTHHEYYSQFVTQRTIDLVKNSIGIASILNSTDPHMNDIPLKRWDDTPALFTVSSSLLKEAGEVRTKCVNVCIGKTAARIIKKD